MAGCLLLCAECCFFFFFWENGAAAVVALSAINQYALYGFVFDFLGIDGVYDDCSFMGSFFQNGSTL